MRIEAVIVCKDYSDFLAETLPENAPLLDDIIVVTHPSDTKTQSVCKRYSVDCVKSYEFEERGHVFNKGAAINLGLSHITARDWILHIDADIVLCRDIRRMLDRAPLNPKNIYGADRVNVYGWEAWQKLKPKLSYHYTENWFVDPGFCHEKEVPKNIKFGARVIHAQYGWVPIGYFQLWHTSQNKNYNHKRGAAAGTDVLFPAQWPRENRVLLPEVVCYHLDSEPIHHIGLNWKGRKSRYFGPPLNPPKESGVGPGDFGKVLNLSGERSHPHHRHQHIKHHEYCEVKK